MRALIWTLLPLAIACGKDGDTAAGEHHDPVAAGEALYTANCAACHGAAGGGEAESGYADATDLTARSPSMGDDEIVEVILEGDGGMPPIGVSEEEADDIVAWMRATWG